MKTAVTKSNGGVAAVLMVLSVIVSGPMFFSGLVWAQDSAANPDEKVPEILKITALQGPVEVVRFGKVIAANKVAEDFELKDDDFLRLEKGASLTLRSKSFALQIAETSLVRVEKLAPVGQPSVLTLLYGSLRMQVVRASVMPLDVVRLRLPSAVIGVQDLNAQGRGDFLAHVYRKDQEFFKLLSPPAPIVEAESSSVKPVAVPTPSVSATVVASDKTEEKSPEKSAEKITEKLADKPAEKIAEKPVEKPAETLPKITRVADAMIFTELFSRVEVIKGNVAFRPEGGERVVVGAGAFLELIGSRKLQEPKTAPMPKDELGKILKAVKL